MEVRFQDWVLSCDPESTQRAYLEVKGGGAESCPCGSCKNFILVRGVAFPAQVLELFKRLGIDYRKEAENYRWWREPEGLHWYEGWFHFIGCIVSGKDCVPMAGLDHKGAPYWREELEPITDKFSMGFTRKTDLVQIRTDEQITQLNFSTKVPWLAATPEPAVWD